MSGARSEKKIKYFERLTQLCETYNKILLVHADNVGSKQMQDIRIALRGSAEMLMGKNTMVRKCLRGIIGDNPDLEKLMPHIRGNVGFVFTNESPADVRAIIQSSKVQAPARAGSIAQCDVHVPAGPTGLEPTQTSFFQALNIATKITRGAIEIINPVHLIVEGTKVGSSEALLLQKLNITPFYFGLVTLSVYDQGTIYSASILDITDDDLADRFSVGVKNIACLSLSIGFPTLAAMPHSMANAYKNILCISIATDYTFEGSEKIKALLDDPEALAAAQAAASSGGGAAASGGAKEEAKEEEAEESDDDMGFGLFD